MMMWVLGILILLFTEVILPKVPAASVSSSSTTTTTTTTSSSLPKTIILIRHAESEENRRLFSLIRCIRQLGRFSLPSSSDVIDAIEFFNFHEQVDTALSDIGLQQLQHVRQKLDESNFVQTSGIQLVAHSPLQRAKQTSAGVLGCLAPHEKVEGVQRVVELETLSEQLPHEWLPIFDRSYVERIAALEDWLEQQPESVIALVGHSQYFRRMLGVGFKFHNCEVWQVTFGGVGTDVSTETCTKVEDKEKKIETESSRNRPSRWTNLQRLYTCDISRKKRHDADTSLTSLSE